MQETNTPNPARPNLWKRFSASSFRLKIAVVTLLVIIVAGAGIALAVSQKKNHAPTPTENPQQTAQHDQQAKDQPKKEDGKPEPDKPTPPTQPKPGNNPGSTPNPTPQPSTGGGTPPPNTPPTPPPAGGFPNASNTGVPGGTVLTNYTGPSYNSSSGITLENMNFPSLGPGNYYTFAGNNITIRSSSFGSGVLFNGDGVTVERSTITDGASFSGTAGVLFRYNNVHSFQDDALHVTSDTGSVTNVTITGNYIHSPTPSCGAHSDGLQVRGVNGLAVTSNTFDMGPWQQVCGMDALNSAIFLQNANGGNSNMTVSGNYLNGGGYVLYLTPGTNQVITNNAFGTGQYGLVSNTSQPGNITNKSGNYRLSDGSPVSF